MRETQIQKLKCGESGSISKPLMASSVHTKDNIIFSMDITKIISYHRMAPLSTSKVVETVLKIVDLQCEVTELAAKLAMIGSIESYSVGKGLLNQFNASMSQTRATRRLE